MPPARARPARRCSRSAACAPPTYPGPAVEPRRAGAARSSASPAWSAPGAPSWRARIFGIDRLLGGDGPARRRADRASRSPRDAIDAGIYLVPEDRKRAGLLLDFSIAENISLPDLASLRRAACSSARRARPPTPSSSASELDIRTPTVATARSARSRAATSRRSCSPNGCR